jgi:hypothetical protein
VARFSYTEKALADEIVDGVAEFDVAAEQNVPDKDHTDYDPMLLNRGVRSQGASIPRMGLNHFFGRTSYNLNLLIRKLAQFFPILRKTLAHNANEYDPQAEYATGDVCYIVETDGESQLYTWYRRVSASPLNIVNVSPLVAPTHWAVMFETTVYNMLSDELPLMDGVGSPGTSNEAARVDHVHDTDTSRAPNAITLYEETGVSTLPPSGTVTAILQAIRNCLKWLMGSMITTLTGDVTTSAVNTGSATATLANTGVTAGSYGDDGATRTLGFGGAFKIPALAIDAKGRVTLASAITLTMPGNPNSDNRGITQLTGDVTAPSTISGSAVATLAASGVTAGTYGDTGSTRTLGYGGTFSVPGLVIDSKGRVTDAQSATLTMPADNRGITQLTGDVTAPSTTSGSAAATIKDSVNLAGVPTADTAPVNTNTTQLATTEFAMSQLEAERGYVPKADPGALPDYGRIWTNAEGLLVVNDHLVEWGRKIDVSDLLISASGGETLTAAVEVSGVYRYSVAGGKGGKGADTNGGLITGGAGGAGRVNEGVVALTATQVVRLTSGAQGESGDVNSVGRTILSGAGFFAHSVDGSAWETANPSIASSVIAIAEGNGIFVGIRGDGYVAVSNNGVTWDSTTISDLSGYPWYDIAYGNGMFIAVSWKRCAVSSDGLAWIGYDVPDDTNDPRNIHIAYGGGRFLVCSAHHWADSADGAAWDRHAFVSNNVDNNIVDIEYSGGSFIIVVHYSRSSFHYVYVYALAGTTHTQIGYLGDATGDTHRLAYGNGVIIVLDITKGIVNYSSSDSAWPESSIPVTGASLWNNVAYCNGKFFLLGTAGKIASSPDGITWQMEETLTTASLFAMAGYSADFTAGGRKGGLSKLENLSEGTTIIASAGGAGGGGAYNSPHTGEVGEDNGADLGGAGGTLAHPNGYPGQGGTSEEAEGYVRLTWQRPL